MTHPASRKGAISPFMIHYGVIWRVLGMILLSSLVIVTIAMAPSLLYAVLASLVSAVVLPTLAIMILNMAKRDPKARFGVAAIGINLAMTLYAIVTIGLIPNLPLWGDVLLVVLAFWHGLVAWLRWRQFETGAYLSFFEPKPKRPSPFQPLRDLNPSKGAI